jgi:hypothetical protein
LTSISKDVNLRIEVGGAELETLKDSNFRHNQIASAVEFGNFQKEMIIKSRRTQNDSVCP